MNAWRNYEQGILISRKTKWSNKSIQVIGSMKLLTHHLSKYHFVVINFFNYLE
uniref:Uncharacterized protein n=1 Tax=Tetranychus urticae TaxID=32264 RepID=T1L2I9_TETUR